MAKLVSKTYGDALFEVALEKNQLDEFLDEVKAAQTAIEENKEEIAKHGIRPISKKEARQLKKIDEKIMKLINKEEKKKHFGKITENTIKDIEENTKIDE